VLSVFVFYQGTEYGYTGSGLYVSDPESSFSAYGVPCDWFEGRMVTLWLWFLPAVELLLIATSSDGRRFNRSIGDSLQGTRVGRQLWTESRRRQTDQGQQMIKMARKPFQAHEAENQ
jgi:hypothetical protein